jgi:two-component system phosphate regulon response regulator PhoB
MAIVKVLLTGELAGGTQPFRHDALTVEFDTLGEALPEQLLEYPVWAFVDWVLPNLSGLELCRRLRSGAHMEHAHITIVLDDDDLDLRRRALRAGADDYIVGPLSRRQVLDRVLSIQPGTLVQPEARKLTFGDLSLDLAALQLRFGGAPVLLMPNELRLIRFFMERPGQIFSREQIIRALGKQEPPVDVRTVDVWIGRLRRALRAAGGRSPLRTVRSMGYVLDLP